MGGNIIPPLDVHAHHPHVSFTDVLEAKVRSPSCPLDSVQFPIKEGSTDSSHSVCSGHVQTSEASAVREGYIVFTQFFHYNRFNICRQSYACSLIATNSMQRSLDAYQNKQKYLKILNLVPKSFLLS